MSGEKAWISNDVLADVLAGYAQTSGSARAIACFIIGCDAARDRHIEGFGESCPLTNPGKRSRPATTTRAVIKT